MKYFKQWCVPLLTVTIAILITLFTSRSEFYTAAYANPNDSESSVQAKETSSAYIPPSDGTTVYGKPPQDLLDLIASQQVGGTVHVPSEGETPLTEKSAEGAEAEFSGEYPVYEHGGWEAVFNHMPEEVTVNVNSARTVNFSNGVSAHICWCLGMKVQTYDPSVDVAGETDEGFTFYQHPISRDLIITDNKTLVAYHSAAGGYTWTFGYDGGRAIRFKDFSFYAFANGRWSIAESSGNTEIKKDGIFQPDVFSKSYGSWTLDEIIRINEAMTQRFMTWLLPLDWKEVPWLQNSQIAK